MEERSRKHALLIVDVRPTFYEGGALACKGDNAVAEGIVDSVTKNQDEYVLLVTMQDRHINPGLRFSDDSNPVDSWPPHGAADTPEAGVHDVTAALPINESVKKGQYAAIYSGFEGINKDGVTLEEVLRTAEITEVDTVGIAESYCIKDTALDVVDSGWPTRVSSGLTVPASEEFGQVVREEMRATDINQIPSDEAFTEIRLLRKQPVTRVRCHPKTVRLT